MKAIIHPNLIADEGSNVVIRILDDSEPCKLILKIGIRRDSIKNYLSRKLLDPEFCHLLDETNDKYWKDIETGEEDGNMSSIFHGRLYQSIAKKYPNFFYSDDHIPLHLGIFADGFQPFEGVAHTLFAVILVCFNLPQEVRMREENLHILTLIDGPKEPNAKFQQYVKPIVDELLEFWDEGWHLHHAVAGKSILCKGACTCCLQDGRASKACSMQSEAGHYHGCRICSLHGQQANGVHYFQHTALLPLDHPYRIEEGGFGRFEDHVMIKDDQFIRSRMEILDQHPEFCNETVFMGSAGEVRVFTPAIFRPVSGTCSLFHALPRKHRYEFIAYQYHNRTHGVIYPVAFL